MQIDVVHSMFEYIYGCGYFGTDPMILVHTRNAMGDNLTEGC